MASLFRSTLSTASRRSSPLPSLARLVSRADGGKTVPEFLGNVPDTSIEIDGEKQQQAAEQAAAQGGKPKSIDDSTSALMYKTQRHHTRPPPLPVFHPAHKSAEDHVLSILYNTPPPSSEPYKRHILNCLVQNEPGVLSRVSGILAARGFNIDSLVVCRTEIRDLSRMCIVLKGQDGVVEQARRQLEDLVPVWAVLDYTNTLTIQRELLLVKISTLGPEYFDQQMTAGPSLHPTSHHNSVPPLPTPGGDETIPQHATESQPTSASSHTQQPESPSAALARQFEHPSQSPSSPYNLNHSEALIRKGQHFATIQALAAQFGGKTVDVSSASVIVEMTGKTERIDAFLGLVRPYGILEAVRSGVMVMPRTPIPRNPADEDEDISADGLPMDASLLPPG